MRRCCRGLLDIDAALAEQGDAHAVVGRIDDQREIIFVDAGDGRLNEAVSDLVALDPRADQPFQRSIDVGRRLAEHNPADFAPAADWDLRLDDPWTGSGQRGCCFGSGDALGYGNAA